MFVSWILEIIVYYVQNMDILKRVLRRVFFVIYEQRLQSIFLEFVANEAVRFKNIHPVVEQYIEEKQIEIVGGPMRILNLCKERLRLQLTDWEKEK